MGGGLSRGPGSKDNHPLQAPRLRTSGAIRPVLHTPLRRTKGHLSFYWINLWRLCASWTYRQFNIHNATFCPHSVFVWISEQTAIISLYCINWLVCITDRTCVYCAVRIACLSLLQKFVPLSQSKPQEATSNKLHFHARQNFHSDLGQWTKKVLNQPSLSTEGYLSIICRHHVTSFCSDRDANEEWPAVLIHTACLPATRPPEVCTVTIGQLRAARCLFRGPSEPAGRTSCGSVMLWDIRRIRKLLSSAAWRRVVS